jgi:hypothetical protein
MDPGASVPACDLVGTEGGDAPARQRVDGDCSLGGLPQRSSRESLAAAEQSDAVAGGGRQQARSAAAADADAFLQGLVTAHDAREAERCASVSARAVRMAAHALRPPG